MDAESRLTRRLARIVNQYRLGRTTRSDAIRQLFQVGFTESEADAYLRMKITPAIIPALATTTLS